MTEWTPELRKLVTDHYMAGRSPEWLAHETGSTKAAIQMALSRWGVHRGPSRGGAPRRPAAPADVASRIAALLGEAALPSVRRAEIVDSDLWRYVGRHTWPAEDLASLRESMGRWVLETPSPPSDETVSRALGLRAFVGELCRLELQPWQLAAAVAVLGSKRAILLCGRQSGKSVLLAAVALHEAVTSPNSKVVVTAGAQRQADEAARKLATLVAQTDELFASVRSSSREVVEFKNGSWVRFLPATGIIRGFTATRVLFDEARDILDEEATYSALEPMLATTNGSMALFSTPAGASGRLWDTWHSPIYAKVRVPSWESKYASPEHIETQRLVMSGALFQCEYGAVFMEAVNSYFSSEALRRCARDRGLVCVAQPGRRYALGIDWAEVRDASVFHVVSKDESGVLRLEWVKAFEGVSIPDQKPYAAYLDGIFHFEKIVTEWAGLGIQISDELERDMGSHRVVKFKPEARNKAEAFEFLKSVVERGEIEIPHDPPKVLAEMRSFEFQVSPSGIMQLHGAAGSSDDHPHALAYATWAFRGRKKAGLADPDKAWMALG